MMSDMDPALSVYTSMLSITAVTGVMAAGHNQNKDSHKIKIPYFQYVFPTPIVTRHRYSVVSRRHYSALLNIPGCD